MIHDFSPCFPCNGIGGLGSSVVPIVSSAGNIAAGAVPGILVSSGAIAAGSLAVPVIGVAIAGVTLAVTAFLNRNSEYFAQEKATTTIVNDAEALMKNNLAAWQGSDKTIADQQQAEENFNIIWGEVVKACMSPNYGSPGQRCVSDRSRGGQWDWFSYYYDPIANDPNVKADVSQTITSDIGSGVSDVANTISDVFSGSGLGSMLPLLLAGGLAIWALKEL